MQHSSPPLHALVLEPSLSLRRDYSVLESSVKYTLKISSGQMGKWNDEVLLFSKFHFITNFKLLCLLLVEHGRDAS